MNMYKSRNRSLKYNDVLLGLSSSIIIPVATDGWPITTSSPGIGLRKISNDSSHSEIASFTISTETIIGSLPMLNVMFWTKVT